MLLTFSDIQFVPGEMQKLMKSHLLIFTSNIFVMIIKHSLVIILKLEKNEEEERIICIGQPPPTGLLYVLLCNLL